MEDIKIKYINAERLKAEIERQQKRLILLSNTEQVSVRRDCALQNGVYSHILEIIDSLQQEQLIQINTLTWKDINDLERIINNVHYEFRNGIGEKSFGEEVLKRFMEERDESEQLDENAKEKALSLQIQAYLTTASDELYAPGKPLYTEEKHKEIHECMKMWQKLHQYYFSTNQEQTEADLENEIETNIRLLNGLHTLEDNKNWYKGRYEELKEFARHFYELGLKARKEE